MVGFTERFLDDALEFEVPRDALQALEAVEVLVVPLRVRLLLPDDSTL